MNKWIRAFRLPFLTATAVPVVLGSVLAWDAGSFSLYRFSLALLGVAAMHIGTNVYNDYYDHKSGNDEANDFPTPFSGGSRVIQEEVITARQMFVAASLNFLVATLIGLYLNSLVPGNIIIYLGVFGLMSGYFYSAPPFKIGYCSLGELLIGLNFGPLVVLGSYYIQTGRFSWIALFASIPVALLIIAVIYINEFPDYPADKAVNKNTLVVQIGREKAVFGYDLILGCTYLTILVAVIIGIYPIPTLIAFLTLPLAVKAISTLHSYATESKLLIPANAATVQLHSLIGILFIGGYVIQHFIS